MYIHHVLVGALMMAGAAVTNARVVEKRQGLGSIQCNLARLRIVGAIGDTQDAVDAIQDPDVAEAATTGLDQARGGIGEIASAILAGEAPPAASRDEVEAGLTAAGDALSGADAADTSVAEAQSSLEDAVAAGQDVLAEC